jgi:hypothetical protein
VRGRGNWYELRQYTQTEASALDRFMDSARWKERYQQALAAVDEACAEIARESLANLRSLGYLALDSD